MEKGQNNSPITIKHYLISTSIIFLEICLMLTPILLEPFNEIGQNEICKMNKTCSVYEDDSSCNILHVNISFITYNKCVHFHKS